MASTVSKEIKEAQASGIDGFALNCGGWIQENYKTKKYFYQPFSIHFVTNYNGWWKNVVDGMFWFGASQLPDTPSRLCENFASILHSQNKLFLFTILRPFVVG